MRSGRRSALRRRFAAVLMPPGVLVMVLALVAPAAAQSSAVDDAQSIQIVISGLTSVLGPGSTPPPDQVDLDPEGLPQAPDAIELRVLVENDGSVPLDNLQLVVEVYAPVDSRPALRRALDDGQPGQLFRVHTQSIRDSAALEPGQVAGLADAFESDEIPWPADGGVIPVRVAVQRGTAVLDAVVTAVVWVPAGPSAPLLTTFVWPIDDVPWRQAGGAYPARVDRLLEPGGRIDTLVRALERRPDAPVVLAVAPHLLEDLQDRADGFDSLHRQPDGQIETRQVEPEDAAARRSNEMLQRLRDLSAGLPYDPVVSVYAGADLSALLAEGGPLADLAAEAAAEGRRRLHELLDRPPDRSTHLVGGVIDGQTVDLLRSEHLLLPSGTVAELDAATLATPLRPLRSDAGGLLTGMVADPYLTELLAAPTPSAGPLVAAQRVLAEAAMVYFASPPRDGRTLLILPPDLWAPDPTVAARVMDGLTAATWLELTDPADQATRGRSASSALELAEDQIVRFDGDYAAQLRDALEALDAVNTALPPDHTLIGDRDPAELHDLLLRSASRRLAGQANGQAASGDALAMVRDVRRAVDVSFGTVVVASGSQVTLTSDTGQIPITLQRTRGGPIEVQIEVASQGRLAWPDGRRSEPILLEEGAAQTVTFETRALSTGTFPVTVRVTDPSGWYELDRTTLSVRSENLSGPALSGIAVSVVVLLLIGLVRRRRRPRLAVVEDAVADHRPHRGRHARPSRRGRSRSPRSRADDT